MKQSPDHIIYLDLDGVLVDFFPHFKAITGAEYNHPDKAVKWANFTRFVEAKGFESAPVLPQAHAVFELVKQTGFDHFFLSSKAGRADLEIQIYEQKYEWLKRHGFGDHPDLILAPYGTGKAMWAFKRTILIDDTEINCEAWRRAEGSAYHYQQDIHGLELWLDQHE